MLDFLQSMLSSLNYSYVHELKKRVMRFDLECRSLLRNDEFEVKKETKLKIVMTKEAASRLLSKCKNGGKLDYDDIAPDLQTIPAAYVRVVSYNAKHD
ncbi:hypothetical protein C2S51_032637 [Perilla frutescens var. frutescens]|nr:hypothetical protein C2S51_032637 [Perilla frutescens var. frutescens]